VGREGGGKGGVVGFGCGTPRQICGLGTALRSSAGEGSQGNVPKMKA